MVRPLGSGLGGVIFVRRMSACPLTAAREQTFRDRSFGPIPDGARNGAVGLPRVSFGILCILAVLNSHM
jgi:hypothetical protein